MVTNHVVSALSSLGPETLNIIIGARKIILDANSQMCSIQRSNCKLYNCLDPM
jgi:hypothetical protein